MQQRMMTITSIPIGTRIGMRITMRRILSGIPVCGACVVGACVVGACVVGAIGAFQV